jgi:hypothetical protein
MHKKATSQSGILNPRTLGAVTLCSVGVLLGMISLAASSPSRMLGASATAAGRASSIHPVPESPSDNAAVPQVKMPLRPAVAGWSIIDSPNGMAPQTLSSVACTSASDCWAVGDYNNGSNSQTLIEHWNGTAWSIVSSPNSSPMQDNYLDAVTCASASDCWAVGGYYTSTNLQTLIEHWNGGSWSIVPSANTSPTQDNYLNGVTCKSASDCWAVGFYYDNSSQTLIEHWNGTSWTIVSSPNTSTTQSNNLLAVTCVSPSDCWAAGNFYDSAFNFAHTLIEHWNGTSWSIVASADAVPDFDYLNGITCVSATDCWAVGIYFTATGASKTLTEHWNGTSWSLIASPNASTTEPNELDDVTCVSGSDCWAVGYYGGNDLIEKELIEHWNGTSWTIVSAPAANATDENFLYGVRCISASDCWAVGNTDGTLIEHWNGTAWAIVTSPNIDATQNYLYDVTCTSPSDCWAVGYYTNDNKFYETLIEHWNGTSWSIVDSPNAAAIVSVLNAVTCASASDCWGVGYYYDGTNSQTLIEHWDGITWSIVTSPNTSTIQDNSLSDVTCASVSNCWAVGSYVNDSFHDQTLIEHWNGTSWSIVTSPNSSATEFNELTGVSCTSPANCWAVGTIIPAGASKALIEHWDGASWSIVPSPSTGTLQSNYLNGITCSRKAECWAVGYYYSDNAGNYQTLIEHVNGSSWSIVPSPNTGPTENYLNGVTCATASDCWTVGYYYNNVNSQTLIEHWNGTFWSIVTSPNTSGTQDNFLNNVTCTSASECWSVGYAGIGGVGSTLIEKYMADPTPTPTPRPSVTPKPAPIPGVTPTPSPRPSSTPK